MLYELDISVSSFHVQPSVDFREGPCTLLTTGSKGSPIASVVQSNFLQYRVPFCKSPATVEVKPEKNKEVKIDI
jgi:hypothetical protein